MSEYSVTGLASGSGFTYNGRGGAACAEYSLVYLGGSDYWYPADADAAATMPVLGLSIDGLEIGSRGKIVIYGLVNNNLWSWTPGAALYASGTPGLLTQVVPVGQVQIVGYAITATTIYFNASGGGGIGSLGALTPGRVVTVGAGGLLTDDADLTFSGDTLTATVANLGKLYAGRVVVVAPVGGAYTKLSDALTAIIDAGATKQYCILVIGNIAETSLITLKSYIDIVGLGAVVTVTSDDAINAVLLGSIVYSNINDITFYRVGTRSSQYVLYTTGGDNTVIFNNCNFINSLTGTSDNGAWINSASCTALFKNCVFTGSSGGASANGLSIRNCSPTFSNCFFNGGNGGAASYGLYVYGYTSAKFMSCTAQGGTSGVSHGAFILNSDTSTYKDCTFIGGSGGNGCYGIGIDDVSSSTFIGCIAIGGNGGTSCYDWHFVDNCSPTLIDCTGELIKTSASFSYNDDNNGRFRPYSGHPYQLIAIYIYCDTDCTGKTVDIGTSVGGNEIANDVALGAAYTYHFFTHPQPEVAASGYLYITPSAAIADYGFTAYYTVARNYATCFPIYLDTYGRVTISGGSYVANGASDALYVYTRSLLPNFWSINNAVLSTLDSVNQKSVSTSAAQASVPIYGCTLNGGYTNVTPDISNRGISHPLNLPSLLQADHTAQGVTTTGTAGENLVFGDVVYLKSDGKYWKTDANAEATTKGLVCLATGTITADTTGTLLIQGLVRDDTYNWTIGVPLFISETAGELVATAPADVGDFIRCVAIGGPTADYCYFNGMNLDWGEL